ncbi:globin-like protein [Xylariaceae sp. FL0255]|nr:globin-like protein [Xylariaceae sp. FL0255]
MASLPTPSQIAIVKTTAPVLQAHGVKITSLFYSNMLTDHPELRNIFNEANQKNGQQPRALANAVFKYASYVDNLGELTDLVRRIAYKHVSLNVQAEQYPIVGKYLLEAVATVLGNACTPEITEAWAAAYDALAHIFVSSEKHLYAGYEPWAGWRRFVVQGKVEESSEITSFYLAPEDDAPLPPYMPGQYISLRLHVPHLKVEQPRQYSLSDKPRSNYYRISVKKDIPEQADQPALISTLLHEKVLEADIVELTHPSGDFHVKPGDTAPMVLISAGVGITPMISILTSALEATPTRLTSVVHGAHSSETRAFARFLRDCRDKHHIQTTLFNSVVGANDKSGIDYDVQGRVNLNKVNRSSLFLSEESTQYFICGPQSFMEDTQRYLLDQGVSRNRCHLEIFGVDTNGFY